MEQPFETGMFDHKGRTYSYALYVDGSMREPWREHDGHGFVRELNKADSKRPGERPLKETRWSRWLYDFEATMKKAKAEGWGLAPEKEAELAQIIGRAPTRREIIAAAVLQDFYYCKSWLDDDWHWCWIEVKYTYKTADNQWLDIWETLGGIESNDDAGIAMYRCELADQLADQLDDDMATQIVASRPDMQPEFRP